MFMPDEGTVLADTSRHLCADEKLLHASEQEFTSSFNRRPFKFGHALHRSGLFEIPQIVEAARPYIEKKGDFCALNFKHGSIGTKFGDGDKNSDPKRKSEQLDETVSRLAESGTWVKLTQVQEYGPEYARVLDTITAELERLSGFPLRQDMTYATMTLMLSSPGISTPFHIDHETNFLFQLQGAKAVCLFPANDRELVTDQEVENYYSGDFDAAHYREHLQNRGTVYSLMPGEAVHHPTLAPHWVKNGDNISVSLSINYCMKTIEKRARVYQANYVLRKIGLKPLPPGVSPWRDTLKWKVLSTLEHPDPKTFAEVVHTPVARLRSPLGAIRRLVKH